MITRDVPRDAALNEARMPMPTITYVSSTDGTSAVEVEVGATVMRTAVVNGIRGILGECGGQAMCATCHVYVEEASHELPAIADDEDEMLECTAEPRTGQSRLSCQLRAGDFRSITVRLPERQV